jgi:hypothetical protein
MKKQHTFFSNIGNVVLAYKHFMACKDLFDDLRNAIGVVEAYWAFGNFAMTHPLYCFAEYAKAEKGQLLMIQMQYLFKD